MANMTFSSLGVNGNVVSELNEVLFGAIVDPENLGKIFTVVKGIANGDKAFIVGDFGLVGKQEGACSPDWDSASLTSTKTWNLDDIGISIAQCWADIPAPFLRQLSNLDGADARRNAYLDKIVLPRLESAVKKMYTRFGWFGDTRATATIGADLKVSANAAYLKSAFKGIWGQAADIVATSGHLVSIAANAEDTRAEQRAAMYVAGVPTGIINDLITTSDPALRQSSDGVIYMTLAMADALEWDLKTNNKGSDLQWQALKDGVKMTKYNGINVVVVPAFDEVIDLYEDTAANMFRALYTAKANVQLGTQGEGEMAEVSIEYDPATKRVLLSALDHFGALLPQNNIVSLAI